MLLTDGYKIVERNFHSRYGEIDIIGIKNDTLIFTEVKARWNDRFGTAQESVTNQKLNKIKKTIDYYLFTHKNMPNKYMIKVMALEINNSGIVSIKIIDVD